MPKISEQQRQARRELILNAAWHCFYKRGLHATTIEDIIEASGLSTGSVYLYFKSKEELILAALTASMSGLSKFLSPILTNDEHHGPEQVIYEIAAAISQFTASKPVNLNSMALLGWSEAQTNSAVKATIRQFYIVLRKRLADLVKEWQHIGALERSANPNDVAKTLFCLFLGFVAQSALLGDVNAEMIKRGTGTLMSAPRPPQKKSRDNANESVLA